MLAKERRGIAIWYPQANESVIIGGTRVKNVFEEHWLRDELISHDCPKPHQDYFYSCIRVKLHDKRWHNAISISGSIMYDPLKQLLFARCASIEANVATLFTALLINYGIVSEQHVKQKQMYAKHIADTRDDEKMLQMYHFLLGHKEGLDKTKKRVSSSWKVAFPNGC